MAEEIDRNKRKTLKKMLGLTGLLVAPLAFLDGCGALITMDSKSTWFRGFIYNYWQDDNGNGIVDDDSELKGEKSTFYPNERITITGAIKNRRGHELTTKVWNGVGKLIRKRTEKINSRLFGYDIEFNPGQLYKEEGGGDYIVEWYLDDNLIEKKEFRVLHR
ncbi:MAG: hypothetical protein AMJ89_01705 [candidate division Zixibacteria bacterium SM23_73]|nr:MAG: hypothetical protein AMJ89_01705 [candidate division Zixibacteria bacterium SM23_73]